ncbi:hypothetical protein DL240_18125 [Lujinxingia litoralis]|uniref:Barstar (barnase inhibitor) domain-containing protein n=1 Tax=Lujinxingia litoralis TaxID=2211119 RepID=A0A328C143_9DELT|nr:hypothetical protein DL240_18125 [Lujinxingia litoralis]
MKECLSYLDEWLPADGYVLVFTRCDFLLCNVLEDREWLLGLFKEVAEWWATPVINEGRFNRPGRPFKLILECESKQTPWIDHCKKVLEERWELLP